MANRRASRTLEVRLTSDIRRRDNFGPAALERIAYELCEDCADRAREEAEIAEASESVVQDMMGFKGRR